MRRICVKTMVAAVILILCTSRAIAAIEYLDLNDGGIHNIDYPVGVDVVRVDLQLPGQQTTVNILEGASLTYLNCFGDSKINVSGGEITVLIAIDSSQVTVSGGSIRALRAIDTSQVTVSGGSIDIDIETWGTGQVAISGGSIGWVKLLDNSQVAVSGGSIDDIHALDNSRLTVSGGSIGEGLAVYGNAVLTIDGSNFAVDGASVGYTELYSILGLDSRDEPIRRLTGTLLSGEPLDNDFRIGNSARIVLIPEPTTLLLLGLGGLMLRKRRQA